MRLSKLSWLMILIGGLGLALEYLQKNPSEQKGKNRNDQKQPCKHHQNVPTNQQREWPVIDSPMTQPSANDKKWQDEEKRYWERQIRIAQWLNWITGVAGVIALIGLSFVYSQTVSTRLAAEAAAQQAALMEKSMKLAERAWVGATSKDMMILMPGIPMKVKVVFKNSGKTPAINVQTFGKLVQMNRELPAELFERTPLPSTRERGFALAPNVDSHSPFTGEIPKLQMIKDKKVFVYFYGQITYEDIFRGSHWTKFCGVYDMDENAFVNCNGYNDVDRD
jgi:hypothetical protein